MNLRTILHPAAEALFGASQASTTDVFERTANGFKLTLLIIFAKSFIGSIICPGLISLNVLKLEIYIKS